MARKKKASGPTQLTHTALPDRLSWHAVPSDGLDPMTARRSLRFAGRTYESADLASRAALLTLGESRMKGLSDYSARYPTRTPPFRLALKELDEAISQLQDADPSADQEALAAQIGVVSALQFALDSANR